MNELEQIRWLNSTIEEEYTYAPINEFWHPPMMVDTERTISTTLNRVKRYEDDVILAPDEVDLTPL